MTIIELYTSDGLIEVDLVEVLGPRVDLRIDRSAPSTCAIKADTLQVCLFGASPISERSLIL